MENVLLVRRRLNNLWAGDEPGEAGDEAGAPVGDAEAVGLADEAFVEEGVVGAFGGCGVLAGEDWVDGAGAVG